MQEMELVRSKIYQLEQTHNSIKQRLVSLKTSLMHHHTNAYTDMRRRSLACDTS
jgi:hypothetical protein